MAAWSWAMEHRNIGSGLKRLVASMLADQCRATASADGHAFPATDFTDWNTTESHNESARNFQLFNSQRHLGFLWRSGIFFWRRIKFWLGCVRRWNNSRWTGLGLCRQRASNSMACVHRSCQPRNDRCWQEHARQRLQCWRRCDCWLARFDEWISTRRSMGGWRANFDLTFGIAPWRSQWSFQRWHMGHRQWRHFQWIQPMAMEQRYRRIKSWRSPNCGLARLCNVDQR